MLCIWSDIHKETEIHDAVVNIWVRGQRIIKVEDTVFVKLRERELKRFLLVV